MKTSLKIGLAVLFTASVIFCIVFFDVKEFFRLETLQSEVQMFGALAPVFFILLYIFATVFFLPGTPLSIASGVLFGSVLGALYTTIGAVTGASLAFVISRSLGKDFVDRFLKNRFQKIFTYNQKLRKNGFPVVLFLRLVPLFPFNALNFALGLTRVSFRDYFFGTLLGILPAVIIFAYFGESLAMLMPVQIAIATVLLLLLIFIPNFYKKYHERKK